MQRFISSSCYNMIMIPTMNSRRSGANFKTGLTISITLVLVSYLVVQSILNTSYGQTNATNMTSSPSPSASTTTKDLETEI